MIIAGQQNVAPTRTGAPSATAQATNTDPVDTFKASNIDPNETGADVLKAAAEMFKSPLSEQFQGTQDFIAAHPFFHHGLMNLPIGGEKHFRNVPFIGPYHVIHGFVTGDKEEIAKGREVTRGTWASA